MSRLSWIDLGQPERSLFLTAPLAKSAGGSQKCGRAGYQDTGDPGYQSVARLVREAVVRAWKAPRRDLEAIAPQMAGNFK